MKNNSTNNLERGDLTPCGGIFVGISKGGVEWVARANRAGSAQENFERLVERMDGKRRPATVKLTGVRSQNLLEIAERLHLGDVENNRPEAQATVITATTVSAPREFMEDLAASLREEAEQWACGNRTVAENCFNADMDWRFEEAANKRVAKSMKRWAAKIERMVG